MTNKTASRIYLIGFMGSGKSHIGPLLASNLEFDFFDLDVEIEKKGMHISEIFNQKGEEYFRETERDVLLETANLTKTVIACGGGTPCFFDNMDWMNSQGITIFLNPPIEILIERLRLEKEKRPLLIDKNDQENENYIIQMLKSRMEFYLKADYVVKEVKESTIISMLLEII
jgi:shikimate kinase